MNNWDILGIAPTGDAASIKRAYARKTKLYHPEDDPQGFQRLREAYETALRQAKYINQGRLVVADVEQSQGEKDSAYEQLEAEMTKGELSFDRKAQLNHTSGQLIHDFMDKVAVLYNNPILRNDVDNWRDILDDENYWHLAIKQQLNDPMLNFLLEHFKLDGLSLLPRVWSLLNQHFFWAEQAKDLYKIFPAEFVDFLMGEIYNQRLIQHAQSINTADHYPKPIIYANIIVIVVIGLINTLSVSAQLGSNHSLVFAITMFVGGLFWGGTINDKGLKMIANKGLFGFNAPYCSFCHRKGRFRIPLISCYINKEACEDCGNRIMPHALVTELLTGMVFFLAFINSGVSVMSMLQIILVFSLMLLITIVDDLSQLILDKLSLLVGIIGFASNLFLREPNILEMIVAAVASGGIFLLLAIVSKKRIGGGIIKLATAIGIVLGWKLAIFAFSLLAVGLFLTGIVMMNVEAWLLVGGGMIRGSGLIFIGIIVGWQLAMGMKLAIAIFGIFVVGLFITGIANSLKERDGIIPVAPYLMTVTYITLLYKDAISKFFS